MQKQQRTLRNVCQWRNDGGVVKYHRSRPERQQTWRSVHATRSTADPPAQANKKRRRRASLEHVHNRGGRALGGQCRSQQSCSTSTFCG